MKATQKCNLYDQGKDTEIDLESLSIEIGRRITNRIKEAAEDFMKKHNENNSDDPWIFYGTYPRGILVWLEEHGELLKCKIKIPRILIKNTGKTFSYSAGEIFRFARYGGQTLLQALAYFNENDDESAAGYAWLKKKSRTVQNNMKKLISFLTKVGRLDMLNNSATPEEFADEFTDTLWYKKGNPFCSPYEASC